MSITKIVYAGIILSFMAGIQAGLGLSFFLK